jgi:hypothetical protein
MTITRRILRTVPLAGWRNRGLRAHRQWIDTDDKDPCEVCFAHPPASYRSISLGIVACPKCAFALLWISSQTDVYL